VVHGLLIYKAEVIFFKKKQSILIIEKRSLTLLIVGKCLVINKLFFIEEYYLERTMNAEIKDRISNRVHYSS
jgi:hypothetical protein